MRKNAVIILTLLSVLLILTAVTLPLTRHRYKPDEIKSVSSSSCGGYLSPYLGHEWDFETNTYTVSVTNSGSSNEEETEQSYPFTDADAERMIAAMNRYGAFDWDEEYGTEGTCEAGESFLIRFSDGTFRITRIGISGDDRPPHYQDVLSAMFYPPETDSLQGE